MLELSIYIFGFKSHFLVLSWQKWTWTDDHPSPKDRKGHSMVIKGTKVYLFGGRANDILKFHQPKTYEIVNGMDISYPYNKRKSNLTIKMRLHSDIFQIQSSVN